MSDEWPLSSEIFRSDEWPLQGGSLFWVGNYDFTPFLTVKLSDSLSVLQQAYLMYWLCMRTQRER